MNDYITQILHSNASMPVKVSCIGWHHRLCSLVTVDIKNDLFCVMGKSNSYYANHIISLSGREISASVVKEAVEEFSGNEITIWCTNSENTHDIKKLLTSRKIEIDKNFGFQIPAPSSPDLSHYFSLERMGLEIFRVSSLEEMNAWNSFQCDIFGFDKCLSDYWSKMQIESGFYSEIGWSHYYAVYEESIVGAVSLLRSTHGCKVANLVSSESSSIKGVGSALMTKVLLEVKEFGMLSAYSVANTLSQKNCERLSGVLIQEIEMIRVTKKTKRF